MLAAILLTAYLVTLAFSTAKAKGSAVTMTERGSSALVFLERNPKAGNHHSRTRLRHRSKRRVWNGLRLSGTLSGFLCIHRYEAAWNAHNYPYGGGLQEDSGFQATYGSEYIGLWGSAGYWPQWAQLIAAYRAHHGYHGFGARGFTPWPNTARVCGLL